MTTLVLGNDDISREERTVKKRRIQSQLLMLLHALECSNGSCSRPNCDQFKSLADHLKGCGNGVNCQQPYCNSSKIILKHWEKCESRTCPVCYPIEVVGGIARGSWRRMLFSSTQQVPDLFSTSLFPQHPPPHLSLQTQTEDQRGGSPQEQLQDVLHSSPQSQTQDQQPQFQFQPQVQFLGQPPNNEEEEQQLQPLPSSMPASTVPPPATNQNAEDASSPSMGPIRSSLHHRRRHHRLSQSRPDAAGFIRRVAKLRGSILSESKLDDVDVQVDDEFEDVGSGRKGRSVDERLEFHRRRGECPVCWENLKAVALQCGHQCCHRCAQNLDKCHSCRSEILLKIKLF